MNIFYDPCCVAAIAIFVVGGVGNSISLIIAQYRREPDEARLDEYRGRKT